MKKIGIDFDGTISDTNSLKSAWLKRNLGMDLPPWQCDRTSCVPIIGEETYRAMGQEVYSDEATLAAPPAPGALESIAELRELYEICVVTARAGARLESTRKWLDLRPETASIAILSAPWGAAPKGAVCLENGIHALIDDDEGHIHPAVQAGVRAFLLRVGAPASAVRDGLPVVRSWREVVEALRPQA